MNIEPIKLLAGSHADTGATGKGCFMNVIAYLNGESQITDRSNCVCYVVRPIAIWLNDFMHDDERHQLLQFIVRAMGSRTDDKAEVSRRLALVVAFAEKQAQSAKSAKSAAKYAAKYAAESAAKYAAESAAESAEYAAKYAAEYAKSAAESAAKYAAKSAAEHAAEYAAEYAKSAKYAEYRQATIADGLAFLDAALPPADEPQQAVVLRAEKLIALAGA